ncbi:MAG: alcohol dehydrogenase catalytic domain-containing protein [Rhizobiaceae bacterium]
MKALVYTGPEALELREVEIPAPADGDVLVKVSHCGICGSDMHAWLGHDERRPAPLILGHEVAGTVVSGSRQGMRVTVNPLATCGKCDACKEGRNNLCASRQIISMPPREGGFAEYIAIPEENLVEVPSHVPFEMAALTEPIACGWHAVRLASHVLSRGLARSGCLVLGGGAIGLGAALSLQAQGAGSITIREPNAARRERLAQSGTFGIEQPSPASSQRFDLVIDGAGFAATRQEASAVVKPGGVIMHIGLGSSEGGLDVRRMTLQEVTFIGTYTYTPQDFRDTAHAIFDGRMGRLDWAGIRKLETGAAAFSEIHAGKASEPKIILSI